jgi:hypothetical protein
MNKRLKDYYALIRAFHLYFGLFISPFIIIFGISVLAFNHPLLLNRNNKVRPVNEIRKRLDSIPCDTTDLRTARAIIHKLGINGEIDYISKTENQISFPVNKPGLRTIVDVNTNTDSVLITSQSENTVKAMNWLHIMPGQHNVAVRGNSTFMKFWKIIADMTVYLIIFLLISGIYLWYFIEIRRTPGWYALILGIAFFAALLFLFFIS